MPVSGRFTPGEGRWDVESAGGVWSRPAMDGNPFENPRAALDWATSVEGTGGTVREEDLYPRVQSWGAQAKPGAVLDLGCGQGVGSTLWDPAVEYTGVDP